jgi:hypothetical protein
VRRVTSGTPAVMAGTAAAGHGRGEVLAGVPGWTLRARQQQVGSGGIAGVALIMTEAGIGCHQGRMHTGTITRQQEPAAGAAAAHGRGATVTKGSSASTLLNAVVAAAAAQAQQAGRGDKQACQRGTSRAGARTGAHPSSVTIRQRVRGTLAAAAGTRVVAVTGVVAPAMSSSRTTTTTSSSSRGRLLLRVAVQQSNRPAQV